MVTLSITLDATQATRVANAIGSIMGYVDANGAPRGATMAEAKAFVIARMKAWVQERERNAAVQAITHTDFTPT